MKKYSLGYKIFIGVLPLAVLPILYFAAAYVLRHFTLPPCFTYTVFRIHCPGCGMTRSVHALVNGNIGLSLRQNVLVLLSAAVCAVYYSGYALRVFGFSVKIKALHNPKNLWAALALVAAYTVARNIFPALAPI